MSLPWWTEDYESCRSLNDPNDVTQCAKLVGDMLTGEVVSVGVGLAAVVLRTIVAKDEGGGASGPRSAGSSYGAAKAGTSHSSISNSGLSSLRIAHSRYPSTARCSGEPMRIRSRTRDP